MFTVEDIQEVSKKQLVRAIDTKLSDLDFYQLEQEDNDLLYIADSLEDVERKLKDYYYEDLKDNTIDLETINDNINVLYYEDYYYLIWNVYA